jgi:YfiH family protein|tara:strand:- start:26 stop:787 length:762 start_codon:yes stop_codon:yes gene_type:complete
MFYSKQLQKYKNINHAFFSRKNGFSKGIYSSLNCGLGSVDQKNSVIKNLKYISNKMEIDFDNLVLMNQTHSNKVIFIDNKKKLSKNINSDAMVTNLKGVALGVRTADCVPIILYDKTNNIIGCIHAGWKGAISNIIKNTLNKFKELGNNIHVIASIGPCIGQASYEVGKEFYFTFLKESKNNQQFFLEIGNDKFLFDIRNYVIEKLKECNVASIDNITKDTFKDADNFYSFRRSQKLEEPDYGRCISTICLKT